MKLILILIGVALVIYFCMSKSSRDGFDGQGPSQNSLSCKQVCFQRHPDAARMYADEDNDVAMTTIDKCVAQCESMRGSGSRTGSGSSAGAGSKECMSCQ